MTGILGKFYVEHGIHGARVMARSLRSPLTPSTTRRSTPTLKCSRTI